MKSSKRSDLEMSDELLQTMAVVMSPRRVPYAGNKRLEEYLMEGRDEFHNLLLQAIHEGALPKRVSLVHSVVKNLSSAHSDSTLDMSLVPVITNPKGGATEQAAREYCAERLAALALISHAVAKKGAVSAHQWLRKLTREQHSPTDGGHILIYSTSELDCSNAVPTILPLAISTAQLCVAPNTPVLDDLNKISLDFLIKHEGKIHGGKHFYDADLAGLLDSAGIVTALPEHLETPKIVAAHPDVAAAYLNEHSDYLAHVAPLAKLGQIVISAPQVLTYHDEIDNLDHNVYDAGLTLLLDGPEPPTPTELLQINIVSRMLAQYAASVFGIARQVALADRSEILMEIAETVQHEVGNANERINSRLKRAKIPKPLKDEIAALINIGERAMEVCTTQAKDTQLSDFSRWLDEFFEDWSCLDDVKLHVLSRPDEHIQQGYAAIYLALNEMVRNAWKYCPGRPAIIFCTLQANGSGLDIIVENAAKPFNAGKVMQGYLEPESHHLHGIKSLVSLVLGAQLYEPIYINGSLRIGCFFPLNNL